MESRKLTKEDIDKVRGIEGFPIGTDEDIIALSDAPYYTACPNPFIEDFIKEYGHPYDEEKDKYHREPFASDVSEGKNDTIYNAHSYHTKVPYKAIMRYILHYTEPGDIVFDGFCGTGMTGVAAQMCESDIPEIQAIISSVDGGAKRGERKAILSDLSPIASFIAARYNIHMSATEMRHSVNEIISHCEEKCAWMFKTKHVRSNNAMTLFDDDSSYGLINYTVWSDVLLCPHCGKELVFFNVAADLAEKKVSEEFICTNCRSKLKKRDCERSKVAVWNEGLQSTIMIPKTVPVFINYTYGGKKYEKKPDSDDLALIQKIDAMPLPSNIPTDKIIPGDKTNEAIRLGITTVDLFYQRRTLFALSELVKEINEINTELKIILTSFISSLCSKTTRYNMGNRGNGAMPGVVFIPSLVAEPNVINNFKGKAADFIRAYSLMKSHNTSTAVQCCSSSSLKTIPDGTIDYIFVDPPFGDNLMYSELNFVTESWLRVKTNNKCEAIVNKTQRKAFSEYQELMTECFMEFNRILKPNRWMTVEFHNSKNTVWNAIQESLNRAGFIIADVRTLDKNQGSFNQVKGASQAIKQDLVISAYKPNASFIKDFRLKAGTDKAAWSFVRQHLSNLPVTVKKGGQLEVISERQAYLLWDRMVAYHIMNGISVPMDAADFYRGLEEKYGATKRDGMYFLPSQVNQYDKIRATCDVENIQFSMFVSDEKSAIGWLYQELDEKSGIGPQTYADLMPKFMQELKAVDKREKMPELSIILEENFLKNDKGEWYIPDYTKSGDIAKLREKNLLKEFAEYQQSKGKLKVFRSEAIRAGFAKLWKDKDYRAIVEMAERLPEETVQEDSNLLMYYDISLSRAETEPTQLSMNIT